MRLIKGSNGILRDPFAAPPSLSSFSGPLANAEFLNAQCASDPSDVERIAALPVVEEDGEQRELFETDVWVFEQLRRLALDQSLWVAKLSEECTRESCCEMRAGEWLYLCAAHASPPLGGCCAIDYIVHTLDGSVALLNSQRYFPSRLSIPQGSLRFLPAIARRLYRSFAHAFFHHRPLFDSLESTTFLYQRFLILNANFDLIEPELLIIPTASEGVREEVRTAGEASAEEDSEQPQESREEVS